MKETEIPWAHSTFNPWWGCEKVSDGCKNCYAESFAARLGHNVWGKTGVHRRFSEKHWYEPLGWEEEAAKKGEPWRVFCASMADIFEGRPEDFADRLALWQLIDKTPHLTWMLLTKRPENVAKLVPPHWADGWPRNAWIGTTVENQAVAKDRIGHLLRLPAWTHFVSMEPLLGHVDIAPWLSTVSEYARALHYASHDRGVTADEANKATHRFIADRGDAPRESQLSWVISGGESGNRARPSPLEAHRAIGRACHDADVPYFFKQGGKVPTLDGWPIPVLHSKGGDLVELARAAPKLAAEGLFRREWPRA